MLLGLGPKVRPPVLGRGSPEVALQLSEPSRQPQLTPQLLTGRH